jgi:hypothetical protein
MRKRIAAMATALVLGCVGAVFGAGPAAAATCFALASPPLLSGGTVVGKNTAGCSGGPANISVYVSVEWQLPHDGGWIEIAKDKVTMSVGQKRSVTTSALCNGTTPSGYRTRGTIYLNGVHKTSSTTNRVRLPCGR